MAQSAFADEAVTCRSNRKVSKAKLVDGFMLLISRTTGFSTYQPISASCITAMLLRVAHITSRNTSMRISRESRARVAFGSFFVVQVRDSNFASVTFDHKLKQFFVVRNLAGLS